MSSTGPETIILKSPQVFVASFQVKAFSSPDSSLLLLVNLHSLAALFTTVAVLAFVVIMIFDFNVQQKSNFEPENKEIQECEIDKDNGGEEHRGDIHDLEKTLGEPSPKTGVLDIHNNPNLSLATLSLSDLPANVAVEVGWQISSTQIMTDQEGTETVLQILDFRNQDADLKIAIKIACLVISVSTTAIVSLLAEFPKQQTATFTRRLLFKAGLLLMCASFFLALVLLILSLVRLNFSCLILIVRGIMWVSAGLMTLSIVLLLIYYFQAS